MGPLAAADAGAECGGERGDDPGGSSAVTRNPTRLHRVRLDLAVHVPGPFPQHTSLIGPVELSSWPDPADDTPDGVRAVPAVPAVPAVDVRDAVPGPRTVRYASPSSSEAPARRRHGHDLAHCFVAPASIPDTNVRCEKTKSTSTGRTAMMMSLREIVRRSDIAARVAEYTAAFVWSLRRFVVGYAKCFDLLTPATGRRQ